MFRFKKSCVKVPYKLKVNVMFVHQLTLLTIKTFLSYGIKFKTSLMIRAFLSYGIKFKDTVNLKNSLKTKLNI